MSFTRIEDLDAEGERPDAIGARLVTVEKLPEFEHLLDGEAVFGWLYRTHEEIMGGRRILGTCSMPTCQGRPRELHEWMIEEILGYKPDFLITLDAQFWLDSDARDREILVYHEITHAVHKVDRHGTPRFQADGRPEWGLRGHDVEEFSAVVRRYGAYSEEIREFIKAAAEYRPPTL